MADDLDYRRALAELARARRVVLTTHVKPDGDALGSLMALRRWLLAQGQSVSVIVPTPPPAKYAFLDPEGVVQVAGRDVDPAAVEPPDLVGVIDTGTWQQLEGVRPLIADSGATILVIDHHRTQDRLGDVVLVDSEAAACAEIVCRLLAHAGADLTPEMAHELFAALAADTDWFRLPSVGGGTLRLAASLVEAGAVPSRIHEELFQNDSLAKTRLMGQALAAMHPALGGRVMIMPLTREMFRLAGTDVGDTENLINECMKVRGVQVGVMLLESENGDVRVSLRSRPGINVLAVAEQFGGGGHLRAAGLRIRGSLDEAEARVLEGIARALAAEPGPGPAATPTR